MRELLVSTGTPQRAGDTGNIGPRPNLRAALEALGAGMELVCTDTQDDDADGTTDCADSDCATSPACR